MPGSGKGVWETDLVAIRREVGTNLPPFRVDHGPGASFRVILQTENKVASSISEWPPFRELGLCSRLLYFPLKKPAHSIQHKPWVNYAVYLPDPQRPLHRLSQFKSVAQSRTTNSPLG